MKLYPLKLAPYMKEVIWGGTRLRDRYNKACDFSHLGETWELSVREKEKSVIENGICKGLTLAEYLNINGNFPLLIKFIDAHDRLSIQVHPSKTEMWYIIEADKGAEIVYGLKDKFSKEIYKNAIENNTLEEHLNFVKVKKGDIFFIPSGLVHAIGNGILIAEIQQNNDTTFRLYDYNRPQSDGTLRQLHIEESLDTIRDFTYDEINKLQFSKTPKCENLLASCEFFTVEKYDIAGKKFFNTDTFCHILCLEGEGNINGEVISKGDSYFIPEGLGTFEISGNVSVIISKA